LILNENNRNEITHFQDKSIEDFITIKAKLNQLCKELETKNAEFANEALLLIDKTVLI